MTDFYIHRKALSASQLSNQSKQINDVSIKSCSVVMPPNKIGSVLAAFEAKIDQNRRHGGATSKTFLNNIATQRKTSSETRVPPPIISVTKNETAPRAVSPQTSVEEVSHQPPAEQQPKPAARSILRKDGRFVANSVAQKELQTEEITQPNDVPKRIINRSGDNNKGGSKRKLIRRKSAGNSKKSVAPGRSRSRSKGPAQRSKSLGAKTRQATDETNGLLMEQIKRSKEILTDISSTHSRTSGYVFGDDGSYVEAEDQTYSSVGTFDFNGSSVGFDQSYGVEDDDDDVDYTVPIETPREHRQGLFQLMKHWSENDCESDA